MTLVMKLNFTSYEDEPQTPTVPGSCVTKIRKELRRLHVEQQERQKAPTLSIPNP